MPNTNNTKKKKASYYKRDKKANPVKYRLKNIYSMFKRRDKIELSQAMKDWLAIEFETHIGEHCHYCSELLTVKNLSCDHIVPLSRGGTNDQINLQFICLSCNFFKGNLTGVEFQSLIDFLSPYDEMKKIVSTRLRMSGLVYVKR